MPVVSSSVTPLRLSGNCKFRGYAQLQPRRSRDKVMLLAMVCTIFVAATTVLVPHVDAAAAPRDDWNWPSSPGHSAGGHGRSPAGPAGRKPLAIEFQTRSRAGQVSQSELCRPSPTWLTTSSWTLWRPWCLAWPLLRQCVARRDAAAPRRRRRRPTATALAQVGLLGCDGMRPQPRHGTSR